MICYHFTAVKWYHITSRVSFLVMALSHWYPHIICNKMIYLILNEQKVLVCRDGLFLFFYWFKKFKPAKLKTLSIVFLIVVSQTITPASLSKRWKMRLWKSHLRGESKVKVHFKDARNVFDFERSSSDCLLSSYAAIWHFKTRTDNFEPKSWFKIWPKHKHKPTYADAVRCW